MISSIIHSLKYCQDKVNSALCKIKDWLSKLRSDTLETSLAYAPVTELKKNGVII